MCIICEVHLDARGRARGCAVARASEPIGWRKGEQADALNRLFTSACCLGSKNCSDLVWKSSHIQISVHLCTHWHGTTFKLRIEVRFAIGTRQSGALPGSVDLQLTQSESCRSSDRKILHSISVWDEWLCWLLRGSWHKGFYILVSLVAETLILSLDIVWEFPMPCATSAGHAASCFTGPCRHFMRAIACRSDGRAKRTDGVVASRAAASFSKGLG